jgi:alpha-D-ribose 1-methylphosphonate 5-triphosphate synthase subunit PhnG
VPTVESIESWRGQDVLDSAGEKVGRLEEVYSDAAGDEPVLISIKRGRLGHQVKLAPVSDAAVSREYVRLPFTGEQFAGAPDVTVGDKLTAEQCAAVLALFAVRQSSGPLVGASLLARRNDEAEQARRRADE